MRAFAFVVAILAAGSATAAPAKPAPVCKQTVVGRGLERHVVCAFTAPVIVKVDPPHPHVLIVPHDGKEVVGRPQSGDRLAGLSHRLN